MTLAAWYWTVVGHNGELGGWQPSAEKARIAARKALHGHGVRVGMWASGDAHYLGAEYALPWDRIDVERIGKGAALDAKGATLALIWKEGAA